MLKLHPARLRGRIGLILLLHGMMMIGVVALFIARIDAHRIAPLYRLPDPKKVALIATAFEHTPSDTHADLVNAFSDMTQHVTLLDRLPPAAPNAAVPEAMARYREALGGRPFRVEAFGSRAPASFDTRPMFSPDAVRLSVALPDGHAVTVEQMIVAPIAKILDNRLLFLLTVAGIDLLVVLWLASQTTRPVERLAAAVREDRLEVLASGGPREIIELATSFRQLRVRLRDLMEERTRMLAAIAHDYRTYLTRLELRTEFIDDAAQRGLAFADLGEMRQLLDDTLAYARDATGDDDDAAVCGLAAELSVLVAQRGTACQLADPPSGSLQVRASPISFQRMMGNLLDNAIRYGGGRASILVLRAGDRVHIMVEDEGPGVPEESLARLIEPFERLDPSRGRETGGVGLGLSIVQGLARRYRGDVVIENRQEGGFRAILILRLAGPAAGPTVG